MAERIKGGSAGPAMAMAGTAAAAQSQERCFGVAPAGKNDGIGSARRPAAAP